MNKSIFQTLKLRFLRFCLSKFKALHFSVFKLTFFVFMGGLVSQGFSADTRPQVIAEKMYSGNAASGRVHTYVYLCRMGIDPRMSLKDHLEKACQADCCSCSFCGLKKGGVGLAFVTVDESDGQEFSGIEETTKNLIWSALSSFRPRCRGGDCCGLCPAGFTSPVEAAYIFQYACGYGYPQEQENGRFRSPLYSDAPDHMPDKFEEDIARVEGIDVPVKKLVVQRCFLQYETALGTASPLEKVDFCDGGGNLRVIRMIGSALFRWKIEGLSMTEVLNKLGTLGVGPKHLVPKYSYLGREDGYNCAMFAFSSLQALGIPVYVPGWSFGLVAKYFLSAGYFGFQDYKKSRSPDGIISLILENYKKSLASEPNQHAEFRIIAIIPRQRTNIAPILKFQHGRNFIQKMIADTVKFSVDGADKRFGLFLSQQFRR